MANKEIKPLLGEPVFTFRAKDNLSIEVVLTYRRMLLEQGYEAASDIIKSIDEWVEQADDWRESHSEHCQLPSF